MLRLLRFLTGSNYWRATFGRNTWLQARLSLKRAHKDSRARKYLLAVVVLLLIPVLVIAYLFFLVGTGAIFFAPFVIPVLWWIRRKNRTENPAFFSISPRTLDQQSTDQEEAGSLREYLARLALVYAVFVDRAVSEDFLKKNEVPGGREVISRRLHLEALKRSGNWERLSQKDRDLLIDADGSWDWQQIHTLALSNEPLLVLRWVLRLDFYLSLIGSPSQVDTRLAREIIENPGALLKKQDLVDTSEIESARDSARFYAARCFAELVSRGDHEAENEEMKSWAEDAASELSGKQSVDMLLDGKLVSEAGVEQVRWALALAHKRADFLDWLIPLIEGRIPLSGQIEVAP